jgi:hypothetical protein
VARILHYTAPVKNWGTALPAASSPAPAKQPLSPNVIETLQREFLPQWQEFRVIQPLKPVRRFGEGLLSLAHATSSTRLETYAISLVEAVDHLDIASIRAYLGEFPDLIVNFSLPEG